MNAIIKFQQANSIVLLKLREGLSLGILSIFCFSLFGIRFYLSESYFFIFLLWNLFLAFVPWFISTLLVVSPLLRKFKVVSILLILLWVLFFPNAPYIITDLFHLNKGRSMPVWFDLILILSFAWTGLLFGFFSLKDVITLAKRKIDRKVLMVITGAFLYLVSFGIYVGRYLRWNSWDILNRPDTLFLDTLEIVLNPMAHQKAWGMTLLMGTMLNMVYWTFKGMQKNMMSDS